MIGPVIGVLYDGFAYGMLLFLLSVGMSVTLGMMNFVNLAHCAFAMCGAFVTVTLINHFDWPFLLTLPASFIVTAIIAIALERVLFHRFYRATDLDQCLVTIGVVFVSIAIAAYLFGTIQQPVRLPSWIRGVFTIGGQNFGVYRLFLIITALAITAVLIGSLEYTRFGARVRAAVDNQRMARGLGLPVDRIFALTFALGCGLAGLGGSLAIEIVGLDHSFALTYLIFVLIVVSLGGMGSIGGTFAAAVLLGVIDTAGKYYVPAVSSFLIYVLMVGLLMIKPAGLFGKR